MNPIVVSRSVSAQTDFDSFATWNETLLCHENTTIADIRRWYARRFPEETRVFGLVMSELDDAETFRRERDNMPEEPMSEKGD